MLVIGRQPADTPTRYAFVVSLLAHAVLVATAGMFVARSSLADVESLPSGDEAAADGFNAGDTFDIDGLIDDEPGERRHDTPEADQLPAGERERDDEVQPAPAAEAATAAEPAPAPEPPVPATSPPDPPEPPAVADVAPPPLGHRRRARRHPPAAESPAVRVKTGHSEDDGHPGRDGLSGDRADGKDGSGEGRGRGRRYGAEGTTRGVRNLARAFTRAIPAAVSADRAWGQLPLGEAGQIDVVVEVDGQGKIQQVEVPEDAPEHMRALVRRTRALLQAGRFALRGNSPEAGRETLRIAVVLSQGTPVDREGASPDDALRLGHERPTRERPGRAYFDLVSGRHFEATITLLGPFDDDAPDDTDPAAVPPAVAEGGSGGAPAGSDARGGSGG